MAGLALLGVFGQALEEMTKGPLRFSPLIAFAVASSSLSLFGLGAAFWAIVIGTAISLLLESQIFRDTPAASFTKRSE